MYINYACITNKLSNFANYLDIINLVEVIIKYKRNDNKKTD